MSPKIKNIAEILTSYDIQDMKLGIELIDTLYPVEKRWLRNRLMEDRKRWSKSEGWTVNDPDYPLMRMINHKLDCIL